MGKRFLRVIVILLVTMAFSAIAFADTGGNVGGLLPRPPINGNSISIEIDLPVEFE